MINKFQRIFRAIHRWYRIHHCWQDYNRLTKKQRRMIKSIGMDPQTLIDRNLI